MNPVRSIQPDTSCESKAQRNGHLEISRDKQLNSRVERLTGMLALNERQVQQLKEIYEQVPSNVRGVLSDTRNSCRSKELRDAIFDNMCNVDQQIQSILNEDQLARYCALKNGGNNNGFV